MDHPPRPHAIQQRERNGTGTVRINEHIRIHIPILTGEFVAGVRTEDQRRRGATRDAQDETSRKLAELRKTAVIGDVITPIEYDWDAWLDNLIPQETAPKPRKARP